ncbi:MAG: Uma2 family endonuclease [Ilyomonas sp.]
MSRAYKILPHYTYDDWKLWEGKWELIEGIPFAMSPSPVPEHQRVAAEINYEFIAAIKKSGCKKCKVYHPIDFVISNDTILEPDILIVCKEIQKNFLDFPPSLVVEILSPSTALKDRNSKYHLYEQQRVKYYLIVDPDTKSIEIYELKNDQYVLQSFEKEFTFLLKDDCSVTTSFETIWG